MGGDRNVRWNFVAAVIDAAGWGVGMGLVSATTILPLFVRQLTPAPEAAGLIQAVMLFGWLVPGILVSGWVERLPRVKGLVVWIALLERSMLLLMVPFCLWLGPRNRPALLAGFFLCWFVMNAAVGANTPGYYKLIAKTIPAEYRGRLYGVGGAVAGLVGVGTSLMAEWLLGAWGFPNGYAACFLAAFVIQTLTVLPLAFMREQRQEEHETPERLGIRRALGLIREDSRLLWLWITLALFSFNQMAGVFYTLYAVERLQAGAETVARFTAVLMGARVIAYLMVGWLGDRHGNRAALLVATASGVAAAVVASLAPGLGWMYLVFALNEIAIQGWGVCSINYVLELCPSHRSSTYVGVFGLVSGPFRVGLPLLAGTAVRVLGFEPVFGAAVIGGALSLGLLLRRLPEPRPGELSGPLPERPPSRPAIQALREE
jgi:MFS family permease